MSLINAYTTSGVEWAFSHSNYGSKPGKCVYLIITLLDNNARKLCGRPAVLSPIEKAYYCQGN